MKLDLTLTNVGPTQLCVVMENGELIGVVGCAEPVTQEEWEEYGSELEETLERIEYDDDQGIASSLKEAADKDTCHLLVALHPNDLFLVASTPIHITI